jgi:hypothetical protein
MFLHHHAVSARGQYGTGHDTHGLSGFHFAREGRSGESGANHSKLRNPGNG